MTQNPESRALSGAQKSVALVGVCLVVAALGIFGGAAALSVLWGGSVAWLNLWVLTRSVQNLLNGFSVQWAVVCATKFVALLVVTYLLLSFDLAQPVGLAAGFGSLPLGIFFHSLVAPPSGNDLYRSTHRPARSPVEGPSASAHSASTRHA